MARIRTIKPEFFTSPDMAELDVLGRLTYIGLWTHADDQGVCLADPRLVHAALFALDESVTVDDIEEVLDAFVSGGLCRRYMNGSRTYLQVIAWHHQLINRPSKPRMPAHDHPDSVVTEHSRSTHGALTEHSLPDQGTGKGTGTGNRDDANSVESASLLPLPVAPTASARKRDPLYDAVVAACGMDYAEMTPRQRDSTGVAVAQLKAVKADPNEVPIRAAVYARKYPHAACTPNALASHWAALNPDSQPTPPLRLSKSMQAFENVARRIGAIDDGGAA